MSNNIKCLSVLAAMLFLVACSGGGAPSKLDDVKNDGGDTSLNDDDSSTSIKPAQLPKISRLLCPIPEDQSVSGGIVFESDQKNAKFRCWLDGKSVPQCVSPFAYSNLAFGEHKFAVEALLSESLVGTKQTCSWVVTNGGDNLPDDDGLPTLSGFSAAPLKGMKITLSWDDVSRADSFKIFRNGLEIAELSNAYSYLDLVPAKGEYSYFIRAVRGGKEISSNTLTVSPSPVAGDINGDGYPDMIVGAPAAFGGRGAAYVYFGAESPEAFIPAPAIMVTNNEPYYPTLAKFAEQVGLLGDVNGDGLEDFGVLARSSNGLDGKVFVFFGSISGAFERKTASANIVTPNVFRATSFAHAGDVNKDGFDDIVIGTAGSQRAAVIKGRSDWSGYGDTDKYIGIFTGTYVAGSEMSVAGVGDFNADGQIDVGIIRCAPHSDGANFETIVEVYDASLSGRPAIFQKKITALGCHKGSFGNIDDTRMLVGFQKRDGFEGLFMICINGSCTEMRSSQQPIEASAFCSRIKHADNDESYYAYGSASANSFDGIFKSYAPVQLPNLDWKYFIEVSNSSSAERLGASCGVSKNMLDATDPVSSVAVGAPEANGGSGKVYFIDPLTGEVLIEIVGVEGERLGSSIGARAPRP